VNVEADPDRALEALLGFARALGDRPVLYWTSDETAVFCARYAAELSEAYRLPVNQLEVIDGLQDKAGMYRLAITHGVPVPHTEFPSSESDVREMASRMQFPIMLKGIIGSRLQARTGKKMEFAHTMEELVGLYHDMEDPEQPNLMLQECIPGGDDQVYIFNGYFDTDSTCLSPFTGHKIRQYPVHVGCASLGICRWNPTVAKTTMDFMRALGYRGILDIGYRLDPRDGLYKVLDVNPRIGQAFRIFVGTENEDVCRDQYLDMTDQTRTRARPREGRRWLIEDYDIVSSWDYYQEGSLDFQGWLDSFRGVEESAWWWWRDPMPFVARLREFLRWQIPRRLAAIKTVLGRPLTSDSQ